MSLLEEKRGPRAHAQLIGGEVSLLDAEDHAAAVDGDAPTRSRTDVVDPRKLRARLPPLALPGRAGATPIRPALVRGSLRLPDAGPDRDPPAQDRGRPEPVPREVRGDVPRRAPRSRRALLPRAQHDDDVWDQLEAGLGQRIAWQALQFGDPRCNRTAFGWVRRFVARAGGVRRVRLPGVAGPWRR